MTDEASASDGKRIAGFVIGGLGIVALGVGGYFGARAFSKWSDREENCVGGCNSAAKSAGDDAKTAATISNIGVGLGLAAVGVGSYLVWSSTSSNQPSASHSQRLRRARALEFLPALGPTGGGIVLQGIY